MIQSRLRLCSLRKKKSTMQILFEFQRHLKVVEILQECRIAHGVNAPPFLVTVFPIVFKDLILENFWMNFVKVVQTLRSTKEILP